MRPLRHKQLKYFTPAGNEIAHKFYKQFRNLLKRARTPEEVLELESVISDTLHTEAFFTANRLYVKRERNRKPRKRGVLYNNYGIQTELGQKLFTQLINVCKSQLEDLPFETMDEYELLMQCVYTVIKGFNLNKRYNRYSPSGSTNR